MAKIHVNFNITANSVDIALFVVEFLMFVVALASAIYAFKAYKHQKERSKKVSACELTQYYADVLLNDCTCILNVFALSGYEKYIKGIISYDMMQDFSKKELNQILTDKNVDYNDFMDKAQNFDPLIVLNCRMARVYSLKERALAYKDIVTVDKEKQQVNMPTAEYICNDFKQDVTNMMNHLEWFSMNCQYGLADEELMYQSLHQTFLSTVLLVYPLICIGNENNEDKHYTNIIWLFKKWRDRLYCIKQDAEVKRQKYLSKAEKVEPEVFSGKCIK